MSTVRIPAPVSALGPLTTTGPDTAWLTRGSWGGAVGPEWAPATHGSLPVQGAEASLRLRSSAVEPEPRGAFRREGEVWMIGYDGATFHLKDLRGLRFLARLLAAPGREHHVLDLEADTVAPDPLARARATQAGLHLGPEGGDEVLDARAREAYRRRIRELEEEAEEARHRHDPERVSRATEEMGFLVSELAAASGLGGRSRRIASGADRARMRVTKAIRAAIRRIRHHSPLLAEHLNRSVVTGTFCSYTPDPRARVSWEL